MQGGMQRGGNQNMGQGMGQAGFGNNPSFGMYGMGGGMDNMAAQRAMLEASQGNQMGGGGMSGGNYSGQGSQGGYLGPGDGGGGGGGNMGDSNDALGQNNQDMKNDDEQGPSSQSLV
jgi:hypothetical protein